MISKMISRRWHIAVMLLATVFTSGVLSISPVAAQSTTETMDNNTYAQIYNRVSPSVVAISVEKPAATTAQSPHNRNVV